jgi:divalent metal cation (Fe/Co/Zn/Cd) transporter
VTEVHETSDRIADEIHRRLPGSIVVIHVEPDDGVVLSSD